MKRLWRSFSTYPTRLIAVGAHTFASLVIPVFRKRRLPVNTYWLVNTMLIVATVVAGDRFFAAGLKALNDSTGFRYSRLYACEAQADVVLIGNSRGHCLYQPEIRKRLNVSTLNLSYNALPVCIGRALIQDYFDLYGAPRKLVIEVTMLTKTDKALLNQFRLYTAHSGRIRDVLGGHSPVTTAALDVSKLYAFNSELFHRSLYYWNRDDADWIPTHRMGQQLLEDTAALDELTFEVTDDRLRDLREIVRQARSANVDVELVVAPYHPAYLRKIENLNVFVTRIERAVGMRVHNYASAVREGRYFADFVHLNKAGAERFIDKLIQDNVL